MALAYDKISALVADTFLPILQNNIFDSNVLAGRMLKKAEKHSSTKKIVAPLEYARNNAQGMIGKYDKMNLQVPDPITAAEYTPITAYQALSVAWEDELEWNSDRAVMKGVKALVKNAEKSYKKMFAEKMYQLNSAKGANDINSLDGLVNATVTMGGIAVADASWWVSNILTTSNFGSVDLTDIDVLTDPSSKGFLEKILRLLVSKATFDKEKPTVLITSQHLFDIMDEMASATINRPSNTKGSGIKGSGKAVERYASMGFDAMQFRNIPIIADDELYESQASDSAGRIYAINEDTLKFHVNAKGNFSYKPFAEPVGQNTRTSKILWRGNLGITNRKQSAAVTGLLSEY